MGSFYEELISLMALLKYCVDVKVPAACILHDPSKQLLLNIDTATGIAGNKMAATSKYRVQLEKTIVSKFYLKPVL